MTPICHVQVLPLMSGVQRAMLAIFECLDRERYEPHVVCQEPGPLSEELRRLEIPCHFIPSLRRPIHPLYDARAYRALHRLFDKYRYPLVHTHSSKPGILGRVAARRAGVPRIVHHVHSFAFHEFSHALTTLVYGRLERWASRFCDRVIVVNHEERELAVGHGLIPAEKCITIYNGVDLARFTPKREPWRERLRTQYGLKSNQTAILVIGRLDVPKQPLILPRIAAALEDIRPDDGWRIVVAGSGPLQNQLTAAIDRHKLRDRFLFLGWQSDPHRIYHAADILLQPSLWEGMSLTLLEAHASALPCVASRVKGNREVVTPRTGCLCAPKDAGQYAQALDRLIGRPAMRHDMAIAARRRAEEQFDGRINMRLIGALYDELLEGVVDPFERRQAA